MTSEAQKRAAKKYKDKYKERMKVIRFELYPTDQDIIDHLEQMGPTATYIKRIIREDIENIKKEK